MLLKQIFTTVACAGVAVNAQALTDVLAATPQLSTLAKIVGGYPDILKALTTAKDSITILAPTNDAFASLPASVTSDADLVKAVLLYHVLPGVIPSSAIPEAGAFAPTLLDDPKYEMVTGGQVVDAKKTAAGVSIITGLGAVSNVTVADVKFDGGIVHVIDEVLTIPADVATTAVAAKLTSLVDALKATDLVATVLGLSDVTIFAPTDAAFAAALKANPGLTTAQIAKILTYHVVPGTVAYSPTLKLRTLAKTVEGSTVRIYAHHGKVKVNGVNVVVPDVLVKSGVVRVIDQVLIPADL